VGSDAPHRVIPIVSEGSRGLCHQEAPQAHGQEEAPQAPQAHARAASQQEV